MSLFHRSIIGPTALAALSVFTLACSHEKREPVAAAPQEQPTPVASKPIASCDLPDTPLEAPQFDYDDSILRPRGMRILGDVASCMQNGSLKGKGVTIVGYADPRGTKDYNRELATHRAEAARDYLASRGVSESRVSVRSRGEEGASGIGPAGWQLDRRVEVEETTSATQ